MATEAVYVELLGESVDVWRRVEAQVLIDERFRLPDQAPNGEAWRFPAGSIVRCESKLLWGGQALVAVELVS